MIDNPGELHPIVCELARKHLIGSAAVHIDIDTYGTYDDCRRLVITEVEPLQHTLMVDNSGELRPIACELT
jgi:hypothetical protein